MKRILSGLSFIGVFLLFLLITHYFFRIVSLAIGNGFFIDDDVTTVSICIGSIIGLIFAIIQFNEEKT
jgi:hypothetical protein